MANDHQTEWDNEHTRQSTFTVMHTMRPAKPLPGFIDFLKNHNYIPQQSTLLDIGCGKGRNSIYLASMGFNVIATDISPKAIADARIRSRMYAGQIEYEVVDLADEWPHTASSIDAIVDCMTTVYLSDPLRERALKEAHRVLKKDGFYLFYGFARLPDDTGAMSPTPSAFGERYFSHDELLNQFRDFKPVSVNTLVRNDKINGADINHTMWVAIFQKE